MLAGLVQTPRRRKSVSEGDTLLLRAKEFLHNRVSAAFDLAENDLGNFLRATKAGGTDHAFECSLLATALLYDYGKMRGRPQRTDSGSLGTRECLSTDAVAQIIANKVASQALVAIEGFEHQTEAKQ